MINEITVKGKLKRTVSSEEVYRRCLAAIKKTGATKNWSCLQEGTETVLVDFGDGKSENLVFDFQNKQCNLKCKVDFDTYSPENFKKSETFCVMKLFYSLKKLFSEYEVDDKLGEWDHYREAMKYRAKLRELTEEEEARVNVSYESGCTDYEEMLLNFISEDLKIPEGDALTDHLLSNSVFNEPEEKYLSILETWLHRTCEYKNLGRVYQISEGRDTELNAFSLAMGGFITGVAELFQDSPTHQMYLEGSWRGTFGTKHGIIRIMYCEKYLPLFEVADDYGKCILAYRFFVSALEFTDFKFVGWNNSNLRVVR